MLSETSCNPLLEACSCTSSRSRPFYFLKLCSKSTVFLSSLIAWAPNPSESKSFHLCLLTVLLPRLDVCRFLCKEIELFLSQQEFTASFRSYSQLSLYTRQFNIFLSEPVHTDNKWLAIPNPAVPLAFSS